MDGEGHKILVENQEGETIFNKKRRRQQQQQQVKKGKEEDRNKKGRAHEAVSCWASAA
jgi:hypothetical protein